MPKNNSNAHRISTAIGTGILCAALAITPIASGILSSNVSAAGGPTCSYGGDDYEKVQTILESWQGANSRFTTASFQDLVNSFKSLPKYERYAKYFDVENSIDWEGGEAGKEALATLESDIKSLGFEPKTFIGEYADWGYLDYAIYAIRNSAEYKNNADLRAAVAKANVVNKANVDKLFAAAMELDPSIVLNDDIITMNDIMKALDVEYPESGQSTKGQSEYLNYYGLLFFDEAIEQAIKNNTPDSNTTGLSASSLYYETYCFAKQIDPKFEVQHKLASDPLVGLINPWATSSEDDKGNSSSDSNKGDNAGNTNTPSTSDKPTNGTIENKDNGVKVSGINININYTLNVNLVPSADLKLTGDSFKNSLSQAFYDIFIRDSQNNVISNTGKVEVSIKLPSNMSAKSDFVVYHVPTAANGEYQTDKAKAVKGVKVSADGWLTFETDHFSVYGIVEYPKHTAPNTGVVAQHEGSAVVTGVKVAAGIASVLTATGAAIVARRQMLRKEDKKA